MSEVCAAVEKKFPCRSKIIKTLNDLIGDANETFPTAIYLYGHCGTGKTAITKQFCSSFKNTRFIYINCVECYTLKILLESILDELDNNERETQRCDNLRDFVEKLRQFSITSVLSSVYKGYVIVLDNAERLRDMDANVLSSLLRLQNLSSINICTVFISQLPFEKYYSKMGLADLITLYCPQYNKAETLRILSADFSNVQQLLKANMKQKTLHREDFERKCHIIENITSEFFNNFLNLFLGVFYKACRDVPELKITARKCFAIYMAPVLEDKIDASDVSRLWRYITAPLKHSLAQVYMRSDQSLEDQTDNTENTLLDQSVRKLAQALDLPYYGKYLLIAAFLASYNSAKEDKRLFVKNHGKQRKRLQTVNAKAKVLEKMSTSLGPKSFCIDRLLAIFYAILEEKVGLTCNILSQISTLVHLKLLSFVSGENNIVDGFTRLQCTVSFEFILNIGKVVGFNVRHYLCDFM